MATDLQTCSPKLIGSRTKGIGQKLDRSTRLRKSNSTIWPIGGINCSQN
jgi:hypothetical protein